GGISHLRGREVSSGTDSLLLFPLLSIAGREPNSCSSSEFKCGDRTCIPWHYICDWFLDCQDGSDEDSVLYTPQSEKMHVYVLWFHTLQCNDGCELGDDGQENSFHREAYDGQEIQKWEPTWDLYRHRKSFWGMNRTRWLKRHLPYLEEEELQRKSGGGRGARRGSWTTKPSLPQLHHFPQKERKNKEPLEIPMGRKGPFLLLSYFSVSPEPPAVRVTRVGTSRSLEALVCCTDGFYPKEINVSWLKDGQVFLHETLHKGALPNTAKTFQAQLSLQIDRCQVEHAGLQKHLIVAWEGPGERQPVSSK
ncbi:class II histocompatibility antigen, B-L beta chain-like, partial [Pogona vitticeps]